LLLACSSIFKLKGAKLATTTLLKRDLNRFTKVYPYARFEKREITVTSEDFKVETGAIDFSNEDGPKTYNFTEAFSSAPAISAISVVTSDNANVNVFVSSISTTTVVFSVSAPFTGQVTFTAIQVT
jgi:hypothetical protein